MAAPTSQPPFPYVLVALTGLMGWGAITADSGWLQWSAGAGTLFLAAAALYQARPVPLEESDRDPEDDDPGDPFT
ncbi:MAG: hypothetical protein PGN07_05025 [Aeromicrobium erythreum]